MQDIKDFDGWNLLKKDIDKTEIRQSLFFSEREIWWCSLGVNVGVESNGKNQYFERPILVIKKFNREMMWAIPLTSKLKIGRYFVPIMFRGDVRLACLSQLKTMSSKRLLRKMDMISEDDFLKILEGIVSCIKNETPPCGGESRRPKP